MAESSVVDLASSLVAGIVAVDGPSGSGKSTLAAALVARLTERGHEPVLVSTDEFATWDDPVAWWPEFVEGVLMPFRSGADLVYRPRVWAGEHAEPGPQVVRPWRPLLIVEGMSSARRAATPYLTRALWLDGGSPEQRLDAAVAREGEHARELLRAWQRFEEGWFAVDRTRERCEVLSAR